MNEIQRLEIIKTAKLFLDKNSFTQDEYDCVKSKLICDNPTNFKATLGDLVQAENLFEHKSLTRDEFDRIKLDYLSGDSIINVDQITAYKDLFDRGLIKKDEYDYLKRRFFQGNVSRVNIPVLEALKGASINGCITSLEYDALRIASICGEATPTAESINKLKPYYHHVGKGLITKEDYDAIKKHLLSNSTVCSPESIESLSEYKKLLESGTIQQSDYDEKKKEVLPSSTGTYTFPDYKKIDNLPQISNGKEEKYATAIKKMETETVAGVKAAISAFEVLGNWEDSKQLLEDCKSKLPSLEAAETQKKAADTKKKKKIAVIIVSLTSLIIVAALGGMYYYKTVYAPNQKREAAMELLNEGKYEEAYSLLEEIGDINTIKKSVKSRADAYLESGDYDKAYALLEKIGDNKTIQESKYNRAVEYINSDDIEEAYVLLKGLDYKDSDEKLASIKPQYKKRILTKATVGDSVFFGLYEQDNDTSNGKEDVEWIVLDKKGSSLLVISKYALESMLFNNEKKDITWENCSLRKWLNGTFINVSFDPEEQKMIQTTTVTADKNPDCDTPPGNETSDKAFLLSIVEAKKYFNSDDARKCQGTGYCMSKYAYDSNNGSCVWWLRSPGEQAALVAIVYGDDGYIDTHGSSAGFSEYGIRPALWINPDL